VYMCVYINTYMYTHFTHAYVCICIYEYIFNNLCTNVHLCVCMYGCMNMYIYVQKHTYILICIYIYVYTYEVWRGCVFVTDMRPSCPFTAHISDQVDLFSRT